ncbi:MAG: DUF4058 family protein [Planctomycetes bacterium]|nr:DUF4058 family protein [Planctomycetota bacterium]
MPMHDWTRVIAGVFHDVHVGWIHTIRAALNGGILPESYYALAEQVADGPIPDVVALHRNEPEAPPDRPQSRGVAVADRPPRTRHVLRAEEQRYAAKANRIAVYHASGDVVVAYIEIVSPGNKSSKSAVERFLKKMLEAVSRGCHLLVIDPHPPTLRDPRGLHARFWEDLAGENTTPGVTTDFPLSLASYSADLVPTAYFEPIAVGQVLPDMPLFLTPGIYVDVPLEATYQEAWRHVPARWKEVIEAP